MPIEETGATRLIEFRCFPIYTNWKTYFN